MAQSSPSRRFVPRVSPAGEGPLYRQIVEAVKREVLEGRLLPGESLPSFRVLAQDLMVSLITVQRAYQELEIEGVIQRHHGKGTFVSPNGRSKSAHSIEAEATDYFRKAVERARKVGMNDREIRELMERILRLEGRQE